MPSKVEQKHFNLVLVTLTHAQSGAAGGTEKDTWTHCAAQGGLYGVATLTSCL